MTSLGVVFFLDNETPDDERRQRVMLAAFRDRRAMAAAAVILGAMNS